MDQAWWEFEILGRSLRKFFNFGGHHRPHWIARIAPDLQHLRNSWRGGAEVWVFQCLWKYDEFFGKRLYLCVHKNGALGRSHGSFSIKQARWAHRLCDLQDCRSSWDSCRGAELQLIEGIHREYFWFQRNVKVLNGVYRFREDCHASQSVSFQ